MFVLLMNDMRFSKIESQVEVCYADSQEEIQAFIEREKVETYRDERWAKSFKKDGPLEWYNAVFSCDIIDVGTLEDRLAAVQTEWHAFRALKPNAKDL